MKQFLLMLMILNFKRAQEDLIDFDGWDEEFQGLLDDCTSELEEIRENGLCGWEITDRDAHLTSLEEALN